MIRRSSLLLAAAAFLSGAAAAFADLPGRVRDEPQARRIMVEVERNQRQGSRFFTLDVALRVAGRGQTGRRMLGLSRGDRDATHLLYVYAWPRTFRGIALVVEDAVRSSQADRIWISLPGLGSFREVEAGSLRLLVPQTGLTYEDSRGWLTPEKYDFAIQGREGREVTIAATPKNDSLERVVGCSRMTIRVDPAQRVVKRVEFLDEAGGVVKTYEATEFARVGAQWLPTRIRTTHREEMLEALITCRYRSLDPAPPPGLFRFESRERPFLQRLLAWRDLRGFAAEFPDSIANPRSDP